MYLVCALHKAFVIEVCDLPASAYPNEMVDVYR
jgi:hypothetical protein